MDLVEARARDGNATERHPWELARLELVRKLMARHGTLTPGAVVVDVGCGDTFVVGTLAASAPGVEFYGVDTAFTDELIAGFRRQVTIPNVVLLPSLDAMQLPPGRRVSLVLLMDVIEHIDDVGGFLRDLVARGYIDEATRFLITVPAYQGLFSSHDEFLGHYRRYSASLLRRHLEGAGLTLVDAGQVFLLPLAVRAVQVVKERLFGIRPKTPSTGLTRWQRGKVVSSIVRHLLVLDANVALALRRCGLRPAGLSHYAICTKSA